MNLMNYWPKLNQSLILYPPIGIVKALFEEVNALRKLSVFCYLNVFYKICQILNTDFSYTPYIIIVKVYESLIYFIQKYFIV